MLIGMFKPALLSLLMFGLIQVNAFAQAPKLVVGIVVDQMRNDYLYRFWGDFGEGGFKRLINKGTYAPNTFFTYVSTSTGPGHASIYTGTTPSNHGIAGNTWYDRKTGSMMYCVLDEQAKGIGTDLEVGHRSPVNLIGSSLPDMLKLNNDGHSVVVSIGIKDRSAILPGGHTADVVLWWDDKTGNWITSDYYGEKLPNWVRTFNSNHPSSSYLKEWKSLKEWNENDAHNKFEEGFDKTIKVDFPYNFEMLAKSEGLHVLKSSPYGNTYTFDLAKAAVEGQQMGADDVSDFLAISFSSTDYIGHKFGPYSAEVHDTYVRFDKDLEDFLNMLDENLKEDYLLFLTADHGVMPNGEYLSSLKMPANRFDYINFQKEIANFLQRKYNSDSLLLKVMNDQIYLNEEQIKKMGIAADNVERSLVNFLYTKGEIKVALTSKDLRFKEYNHFPHSLLQKGFHAQRSGNILFQLQPYSNNAAYTKGAGHSSAYNYDTQVPLIWYGKGIRSGKVIHDNFAITQIAPTLADLLKIQRPPMCDVESMTDVIMENR